MCWLKEVCNLQVPPSIFYIPDFVTEDEEQFLLKQIYGVPKPKWTYLSNRRLQNWGELLLVINAQNNSY